MRNARKAAPIGVESGAETAQARSGELSIEARLLGIIEEAFERRISKDVIVSLVSQRFDSLTDAEATRQLEPEAALPGDVVYDELPEGLIDLPSAQERYGISRWSVYRAVEKGHINFCGRLRASARGGGYLLVDEAALVNYMASPKSKGGRPRKSAHNC